MTQNSLVVEFRKLMRERSEFQIFQKITYYYYF